MAEETTPTAPEAAVPAPAAAVPAPVAAPAASGAPAAPAAPADQRTSTSGDKQVSQNVWLEIGGEAAEQKVIKAKGSKNVSQGLVHVYATFNNTIVTITDRAGGVIGWSTAGKMGFRGSRKGTAYAAQVVAQDACRQAMGHGLREAEVRLRGPGSGRESAVRAVQALGVEVTTIKDVTPIPHNGCRPPKARRV
ncbi:MAG: 30S ribosomal protein S11 [Prosthecobacter sp.]|uniref:30S ribosomal protein S11 n=1 Tax=Prosthecobacter sp. TaxID=1965333 RepID=UPI0031B9F975|nr:30S ribosomal protein S11 [Prosthecobacter sp.]